MIKKAMIFFILLIVLGVVLAAKLSWAEGYSQEKIGRYLKSQQNARTGLVNSFSNTADLRLLNQASIYDQALAVMAFLLNRDEASAARILDFFNTHWSEEGFSNFYYTLNGETGLETTIHLGPNAWIALAALNYDAMTGKKRYAPLAKKITLWMARLPYSADGGIAMGPREDWGANWREVFSAENNIDALMVFRQMARQTSDESEQRLYCQRARWIAEFLKKKIFSRKPRIPVGPDSEVVASDVFAFALLAFEPRELEDAFAFAPEEMFRFLDEQFLVETDGIFGYDFTDLSSKKTFARRPMISLEWSAMIALAYVKMSDHEAKLFARFGDPASEKKSRDYQERAAEILGELDKKAMASGKNQLMYPYATKAWEQVFPFAPWWRTPQRGESGRLAGSLAGTCWRVFAEKKFNPFEVKPKSADPSAPIAGPRRDPCKE